MSQKTSQNLDRETILMLLDPRSPLKGRSPPPYAAKLAKAPKPHLLAAMGPKRFNFEQEPRTETVDDMDQRRQ